MKRLLLFPLVALSLVCLHACSTPGATSGSVAASPTESDIPIVVVVPGAECPDTTPDLTTVTGAELDQRGLTIRTRTTTYCNNHDFEVHLCDETDTTTTYRVSETNDCEVSNDGVVEHFILVERMELGTVDTVESFDADTVTIGK